jgi:hypothetical protein
MPGAKWVQSNVINPIFGDPNQQQKDEQARTGRLRALKNLRDLPKLRSVEDTYGTVDEGLA